MYGPQNFSGALRINQLHLYLSTAMIIVAISDRRSGMIIDFQRRRIIKGSTSLVIGMKA